MKRYLLFTSLLILVVFPKTVAQTLLPTFSISAAGAVDSFSGGYTFSYSTAGSPWNGSLISYGGFQNNYDCQISSDYGPHGGKHISFRTKNGDINNWNPWYEIWNSANLNRDDIDFNCKNLYVNGNIWAKEIKVALTNPWADYVFDETYKLPTLYDVEKYIKENKHLQNVPTAQEIAKNGLELGEMVKIQQEKIEELTLYLIQQNAAIDKLKKENESFKKLEERLIRLEKEVEIKK